MAATIPQPLQPIVAKTGSFEGHPIFTTITETEIQEMLDAGLTMEDIQEIAHQPTYDWQADC